jgi:putative transposase
MRRPNLWRISQVPTVVPSRVRMHVNHEPLGSGSTSVILRRQAAQVLHFGAGSLWQFGLATVAVIKPVAVDKLLVRYLVDAHTEIVNVAVLRPIPAPAGSADRHVPIDQHSPKVWARARQEEKLLAPLLEHSTRQDRARVAKALNLSDRQIRRKLRRYEALRSVEAFLPFRRGPLLGSTQVDPEIERLMDEQIRLAFKVSPDIGVDDLLPIIATAAAALDLPAPGRSTVSRRLRAARRNVSLFPSSLRRELSNQRRPVRSRIETGAPLSVVEIDHTIADVHLIEAQTGATIGRPVLTMAIDRATRVILGLLLSLEAPSQLSIGLCLHHATFSKDAWLKGLGLSEACWPGFGLATTIISDNGQEFHGKAFRRAAQVYGIDIQYRPLGHPAAGGIIERAIGTFMTKVRLLPGASYSKLLGKKPRQALRGARMTLKELELYLARQVSAYHKSPHGTLEVPPVLAWERAWRTDDSILTPSLPSDSEHFLITFLPGEWRTVSREGIALHSLRYRSPDLIPHIFGGCKQMVRFDPRDMSRVYLETRTEYVVAELADGPAIPFSLWEWREIRDKAVAGHRVRHPERLAEELIANRAMIQELAHRNAPGAARRVVRQSQWFPEQAPRAKHAQILKARASRKSLACRVDGEELW